METTRNSEMAQEIPHYVTLPCLDPAEQDTVPGDWLSACPDVAATCSAINPSHYASTTARLFGFWNEIAIPRDVDFLITSPRQVFVLETSSTVPRALPSEALLGLESCASSASVSRVSGLLQVAQALFADSRDATNAELTAFDRTLLSGASIFKE